jgi:hypothetical protein
LRVVQWRGLSGRYNIQQLEWRGLHAVPHTMATTATTAARVPSGIWRGPAADSRLGTLLFASCSCHRCTRSFKREVQGGLGAPGASASATKHRAPLARPVTSTATSNSNQQLTTEAIPDTAKANRQPTSPAETGHWMKESAAVRGGWWQTAKRVCTCYLLPAAAAQ